MNQTNNLTREKMLELIDEFHELYKTRPITDNNGGMKSGHMFPSWFVIKVLQPKYIIESGVWKGLGTWFFEKASPNSKIISIDPNPGFRVYTSDKVDYRTTDFTLQPWNDVDKENTLVFLDDHQNSLQRIKFAKQIGFKHIMVEDNYPYNQGDCYTPKKILSQKNYVIDLAGNKTWYDAKPEDYEYFTKNVTKYIEFPPLFKDKKTRWGDDWSDENYETHEPLLSDIEKYLDFFNERKDYTWICYLEL
jgi:hypothetical protein